MNSPSLTLRVWLAWLTQRVCKCTCTTMSRQELARNIQNITYFVCEGCSIFTNQKLRWGKQVKKLCASKWIAFTMIGRKHPLNRSVNINKPCTSKQVLKNTLNCTGQYCNLRTRKSHTVWNLNMFKYDDFFLSRF